MNFNYELCLLIQLVGYTGEGDRRGGGRELGGKRRGREVGEGGKRVKERKALLSVLINI